MKEKKKPDHKKRKMKHRDEKEDKVLIKKEVKKGCMK